MTAQTEGRDNNGKITEFWLQNRISLSNNVMTNSFDYEYANIYDAEHPGFRRRDAMLRRHGI
jgi:hypothetical protein